MESRLGTELLTRHYVGLLPDGPMRNHVGIVDTQSSPARTCRDAIEYVQKHLAGASEVGISLEVHKADIQFSFITTILFWILVELIKDSVLAVLRSQAHSRGVVGSVEVSVCAGSPKRVGIKISDKAGGIPFEHVDKIWQY